MDISELQWHLKQEKQDLIKAQENLDYAYTINKRLKTDIHTIDNALEIVGKLRGVNYKWLNNGQSDVGVIAQEVEAVVPEVVKETDNGTKTVDYGRLVCVLIESVKELTAKVNVLENK